MNLSVRTKLIAGFGLMIVLIGVVFAVGYNGMNNMAHATDIIVHEELP